MVVIFDIPLDRLPQGAVRDQCVVRQRRARARRRGVRAQPFLDFGPLVWWDPGRDRRVWREPEGKERLPSQQSSKILAC